MKYQILDHTADLRIKIFGRNEEELFLNALEAIALILKSDFQKLKKRIFKGYKKIKVTGNNLTEVLINFLNEILTNTHIDKKIYNRAKILKLSSNFCEAQIFGFKVNAFEKDIKAITYHQAEIEKDKKGHLKVILICDV